MEDCKRKAVIILDIDPVWSKCLSFLIEKNIRAQRVNNLESSDYLELDKLHEQFSASVGSDLDGFSVVGESFYNVNSALFFKKSLERFIKISFTDFSVCIFNAKYIWKFLPLWIDVFKACGIDPCFLIGIDKPSAYNGALNYSQLEQAYFFWSQQVLESEYQTRLYRRSIIFHQNFFTNYDIEISRIAQELDLNLYAVPENVATLEHLVSGVQNNSQLSEKNGVFSVFSDSVFKAMKSIAEANSFRNLDVLYGEKIKLGKLISPWIASTREIKCLESSLEEKLEEREVLTEMLTSMRGSLWWRGRLFFVFLLYFLYDLCVFFINLFSKDKRKYKGDFFYLGVNKFFVFLRVSLFVLRKGFLTLFSSKKSVIADIIFYAKKNGFFSLIKTLAGAYVPDKEYREWFSKNNALAKGKENFKKYNDFPFEYAPLISIVMPVYNTREDWLRRAIDSVLSQEYPNWELCVSDDCSEEPHVAAILDYYQKLDPRIKLVFREKNGHICAASNSAIDIAHGEFITFLDHDDELSPYALYLVARALQLNPRLDLIYSDYDRVDIRGNHYSPYFKPDWNPDLFLSQNMLCHLVVYRAALVRSVGGFSMGLEGSQDWDLGLKIVEKLSNENIFHLPYILYHWHAVETSTAKDVMEKPYALDSAVLALGAHFKRICCSAIVKRHGIFPRVYYPVPDPPPLVSIIYSAKRENKRSFNRLIEFIAKTDYQNIEILIPEDFFTHEDSQLKTVRKGVSFLCVPVQKDYLVSINEAAKIATGEVLCIVDECIDVINKDWLGEMLSHALRPGIGAVGGMVYYPDDRIFHAGVILGITGTAGFIYRGMLRGRSGMAGRATVVQNMSAVSGGCMVIRKEVFLSSNGFDSSHGFSSFLADVDLCLRLLENGYRNVWTPFAEFYTHLSEAATAKLTGRDQLRNLKAELYFRDRWSFFIQHDPAHNPNLALDSSGLRLEKKKRREPWWQAVW